MSLTERFVNAVRSATNRGLRQVMAIVLVGYGLLLVGVVFVDFTHEYEPTLKKLTATVQPKPDEKVPTLPRDSNEQKMIDRIQAGELPVPESWSSLLEGFPILYAYPMASLYAFVGLRGPALFNIACTLLAMWLVYRIGVRIWSVRAGTGGVLALAEGQLGDVIEAAKGDLEVAPKPFDPLEMPIMPTLFGVVAMCIYGINPIVFDEATGPSPRPFAYLLGTLAMGLSLRVIVHQPMPSIRCGLLILTSGLVHLPALLMTFPVLLFGWFGGFVRTLENRTILQRLGANSRKIVFAVIVAAMIPLAGRVLTSFDSIDGALASFVNDWVPAFMRDAVTAILGYVKSVVAIIGTFLVTHAPHLAVLSMVPLPSMKGIVERTMLLYAVGLLGFFSFLYPNADYLRGDYVQLYPVMIPTAFLGAFGVVNVIDLYIEEAVIQLGKLWLRFFGVLAGVPVIGGVMVWLSEVPVDDLKLFGKTNLALNGWVTPYTLLIAAIALTGLLFQLIKLRRRRREEAETAIPAEPG